MIDFSVVVPIYNAELTIEILVERLRNFFEKYSYSYQIILVYDWGEDNSWEKLIDLKKKYPDKIKVIKLTRNFGQHNATIAGIKYADGKFIVTIDEDLQNEPSDIQKLINKQKEKDYDVVYGKPLIIKHSFYRRLTSKIFKKLITFSFPELHNDYSSFRLIKHDIAKKTLDMNNSYTFLDGYLAWITTHVSSIKVSHNERLAGKSSYTLIKLINHSINIFITFSNFPIRLVTFISFIVLFISSFFSIYLIFRKLFFYDIIPGYTSITVILGFGIGLILFSLGIIGEYIHRINLKTTKRPNFIEKEVL